MFLLGVAHGLALGFYEICHRGPHPPIIGVVPEPNTSIVDSGRGLVKTLSL